MHSRRPLRTTISIGVVALGTIPSKLATAFLTNGRQHLNAAPCSQQLLPSHSLHHTRPPSLSAGIGDIFSSLTGTPPKALDPPLELLAGTSIDPAKSSVNLVRCYKASVDGWSAIDFHRCVDGRGSCLVVARSNKSNKRFGGFNALGWQSTDDYGTSNAVFLWFDGSAGPVKVPVLSGGGACIFDYATSGPCFGAGDLVIGPPQAAVMGGFAGPNMENTAINAGSLKQGRSSPGGAYESPSGWPCRGEFKLVEVEVYCNGNIQRLGSGGGKIGWWPF